MINLKINKIISVLLIVAMSISLVGIPSFAANTADNGEVYLNSSGRIGIVPTLVPKNGVAEWAPLPGETSQRIHIKRNQVSESHDVYFDVRTRPVKNIDKYVFEMDVYPKTVQTSGTLTSMTLFRAIGTEGVTTSLLTMSGLNLTSTLNGPSIGTLPLGEWSTVSIAADISSGDTTVYDVYVNRNLIKSGITASGVSSPERFRVAINNSYRPAEFYFDNFRLYEGDEFRDFDGIISTAETADDVSSILGTASVFMTNAESLYTNGIKKSYAELGYSKLTEDDVFYVSSNAASDILGLSDAQIAGIKMHRDGIDYVSLTDAATLVGKHCYCDDRGWICVSDEPLNLSNSVESKVASEDSDVIDRFMQFDRPTADSIYDALVAKSYRTHPRLFITPEGIDELKRDMASNKLKADGAKAVIHMADNLLDTDVVEYKIPDGIRLFTSCLTVRNRLFTLSTAYMITEDANKKRVYVDKIWEEIYNALVVWPDWNLERHYLDSGKIGTGIAVAYDVCYNDFTAEQRSLIRTALCEKYLYYALSTYAGSTYKYEVARYVTNWGAVCNTSALMLCLATMDEEDADSEYTKVTKYVASQALQALEWPIGVTYPNGAWEEGLTYFEYVIEHLSWSACSLMNSCGSDYGILEYPGVSDMPLYAMYIQTLGNGYFNFSDGALEDTGASTSPEVFLMARLLGDMQMNDMWYDFKYNKLNTSLYTTQAVRDFLFYTPGSTTDATINFPLDAKFGNVEIAVMKSGWDADDTYLAALGGKITSHWDKGGFIYEALGERWAVELGKDDYNIAGGYYNLDGATIYRKRAEGHNTLVFNPDEGPGQVYGETAVIKSYSHGSSSAYAIYDLSRVYSEDCVSAQRGFHLGNNRRVLTVQDEFELIEDSSEVMWFMHTRAQITVAPDGKSATLTQNGKSVKLEFVSSLDDWKVEAVAAEPLPTTPERSGQADNSGFSKIRFSGKGSGEEYITARIIPLGDGNSYGTLSYIPMSEWNNSGSITIENKDSLTPGGVMELTCKIPDGCTGADVYFGDNHIGSVLSGNMLRYIIPPHTESGKYEVSLKINHSMYGEYSIVENVTVIDKVYETNVNVIDFEKFDSITSDADGMTATEAMDALGCFNNIGSKIDTKGAKVYIEKDETDNCFMSVKSSELYTLTCHESCIQVWANTLADGTHSAVSSGKLALEFDAYLRKNWTTRVIAVPFNSSSDDWGSNNMLVDQNAGGIVMGDGTYTSLRGDYNWYHFNIIYDLDKKVYYGTISDGDFVKPDAEKIGEVVIPEISLPVPSSGKADVMYYRVGVGLNKTSEFKIDNIRTSYLPGDNIKSSINVTDGKANALLNVYSDEAEDAYVYTVMYSGNRLEKLYSDKVSLAKGANIFESPKYPVADEYTDVKIFVWSGIKPISQNLHQ